MAYSTNKRKSNMKKVKSTALVIVLCLAVAAVCLSVRTETSPRKIVSAAVGYAWTDGTDRDLDALLQRADEKVVEIEMKDVFDVCS